MQRPLALTAVIACLLPAGAAVAAAHPTRASAPVRAGSVVLRTTDDAGHCATRPQQPAVAGTACPTFPLFYAAPAHGRPRALVVVFHGHGHNGEQYTAQLADLARRDHIVAVAPATAELAASKPNYRGPFDSVDEEARDAAAAIGWARARWHTGTRTYVLGVSMGGSGLAYFVDAATRPAQGDVDATWVQRFHPLPLAGMVDAEGIASLAETWAEASGFDKTSEHEIEAETGGTPSAAAAAYQSRSLALLPTSEWQATGLPTVAVVHDVDDGLVPYNQTWEARAAIAAAGIPVQTYDIVFNGSCTQGNQTTGTYQVTNQVPGFPVASTEQALCLAGHANENDATTPVMRAAVTALEHLLTGATSANATVGNPTPPSG